MPTRKAQENESHVHLMLDKALWKRVRVAAAQDETTAVEIVRRALAAYLKSGRESK